MVKLFGNRDLAPNIGVSDVRSWYKTRTVRCVLSFATVASLFCSFAAARISAGQVNHEGHQGGGPVPREILERPVPLRQGIGSVHAAVTASSPQTQASYDLWLAYAHSFMLLVEIR